MPASEQDGLKRPRHERLLVAAGLGTLGLVLVLLTLRLLRRSDIGRLFDDAYIFQRYAHNLLSDHRIAWNPHGPPTFGTTSLLFLLIVTPLHALTRGNAALAGSLSSLVCGIGFLLVGARLIRTVSRSKAWSAVAFIILGAVVVRSSTIEHFTTGMDTTFALAFLTIYLLAAHRAASRLARRDAVVLGGLGAAAFWVRPELAIYSLVVPLACMVLPAEPTVRALGRTAFITTLAGLGTLLILAWLYFGHPLPLPFYAKSTGLYGASYAAIWEGRATLFLRLFAGSYWPLVPFLVAGFVLMLRDPRTPEAAIEMGVLAGTLLLGGYVWRGVLPIMGFYERFFQPIAPALLFLTLRALSRLAPLLEGSRLRAWQAPSCWVALGGIWCILLPDAVGEARALDAARRAGIVGRFDLARFSQTEHSKYWFRLNQISELPDDLTIATTEVGALGAMNLRKQIIDMSGLNEPALALHPFSGDAFLARFTPDLIYLPHPDYRDMNRELSSAGGFRQYETFTNVELHTRDFGIAILRTGKYRDKLDAIVSESFLDDAAALVRGNQPLQARALAARGSALNPSSTRAPFLIGLSWDAQNDPARAVAAYQRSVELDPRNVDADVNLGFDLARLGKREEAIRALALAVEREPGNTLARNDLAWARSLPEHADAGH
jgi:tetratricopeptide (TPR) repeat protein